MKKEYNIPNMSVHRFEVIENLTTEDKLSGPLDSEEGADIWN